MLNWPNKRPRLRVLATAAAVAASSSLASLGPSAVPAGATLSFSCPNAGTVCVSYASERIEPAFGGGQVAHIFGQVHNETNDNATLVGVNLSFPNSSGVTLTDTAWSSLDVLARAATAPFEVFEPPPPSGPSFTITGVRFARSTATPYAHLSIASFGSCSWDPANPDVRCGTVLNSGTGAVAVHDVHVVVTFSHKDGTNTEVMVSQNRVSIDPIPNIDHTLSDTLLPGDSGSFTFDRAGDPPYDAVSSVAEPAYPLDLSRDTLDFGHQLVGTTSVAQNVRVANNGSRAVSIAISPPTDFTQTNDCGSTLAVGQSCNVAVQFAPGSIGDETGAYLTITTDEAGNQDTVHLLGTGVAPRVKLDTPGGVDFGVVAVGASSAPLSVVLTNTGNATLIYTIGTSADLFLVQPTACTGTLPQQQSCTMQFVWAPAAPWSSSPTLTLTDNAPDHHQQLTFSGYGVGPALAFDPPTLDFGDSLAPTSQQTVNIINTGNADLVINSISTTGPFAANPCASTPFTLAPGARCLVAVSMISGGGGSTNGYLIVADNAGGHQMFMTGSLVGIRLIGQSPPGKTRTSPPPVGH